MPYLIGAALGVLGLGGGYAVGKTETTLTTVAKAGLLIVGLSYAYKRFR